MGKTKERKFMIKKAALLFILVAFVVCVYGCETAKGVGTAVKRADEWMQKILW
jgi:predicted small secreted protein